MIATKSRVIVRKLQPEAITASGIVLRNPTEPVYGQVVSCGPRVTTDIKPGNQVVVDWSRVGRFEYLEQEYFIVDESNILAVVTE